MIVRILGEGQYEVAFGGVPEFEALDQALIGHVEGGDEEAFRRDLSALVAWVREHGSQVAHDHLGASDLVIPSEHMSLEEVRRLLQEEGETAGR